MGQRLAILGGGQLARMLATEAHRLGLEPHIYSGSQRDPATEVTRHWTQGELSDFEKIKTFLKDKDYLTFESEFVPDETLLALESIKGCVIFPKPSLLRLLQKRSDQKKTLQKYKVAALPFIEVKKPEDLDLAWKTFKGPFVLKSQRGGYDGYGTHYAQKLSDLSVLAPTVANSADGFIAEPLLKFKRELAIMMIRNSKKKIIALPLVQTEQTQSRCDWVIGPIQHPRLKSLTTRLEKMLHGIDYVGAIGVEFFDLGKTLLVNEIAPRVHNSGHFSQDALLLDQFTLHLRAGLGESLPVPFLKAPAFVMINLLGASEMPLMSPAESEGHAHLYGKHDNRPGRKMGHINYLGKNAKSLLNLALRERKKWQR
jgi:5-(carboxyamino)imidazole ribonucleotide synthase